MNDEIVQRFLALLDRLPRDDAQRAVDAVHGVMRKRQLRRWQPGDYVQAAVPAGQPAVFTVRQGGRSFHVPTGTVTATDYRRAYVRPHCDGRVHSDEDAPLLTKKPRQLAPFELVIRTRAEHDAAMAVVAERERSERPSAQRDRLLREHQRLRRHARSLRRGGSAARAVARRMDELERAIAAFDASQD